MNRLLVTATTFLLVLGAAIALGATVVGKEAVERGERRHHYRTLVANTTSRAPLRRPFVVWMGDSTIESRSGNPSYPRLLQRSLGNRVEIREVGLPGFTSFHFYYILGPILDLDPDLVVMVANIRMFYGDGTAAALQDLASEIPAAELWRTLALPISNQITLSRLLGYRLLRTRTGEQAFFFAEGVRTMFQEAKFWSFLPGAEVPAKVSADDWLQLDRALEANFHEAFGAAIDRSHPLARMLQAAVAMCTRRGVPALVVASPIPVEKLALRGHYPAQIYRERMAVLGTMVREAGGEFVDLHDRLPDAGFRDFTGHFSPAGNQQLAQIVEPLVVRRFDVEP